MSLSHLLKAKPDGYSDGLCRACAPHAPAHRPPGSALDRCRTAFREPLQIIVMSVMVIKVLTCTISLTYWSLGLATVVTAVITNERYPLRSTS